MNRPLLVRTRFCCATLITLLVLVFAGSAIPQTNSGKDCEQLKKDVTALQDEIAKLAAQIQANLNAVVHLEQDIAKLQQFLKSPGLPFKIAGDLEAIRSDLLELQAERLRLKRQIEQDKETIQAIKDVIADMLNKLGSCGEKKSEIPSKPQPKTTQQPTPNPTPSTTNKVTDVLKSIGSSVDIGIGGGSSGQHRHGQNPNKPGTQQKNVGQKPRTPGNLKTASNPQIARCQQAINYHTKQKQALEQKLHSAAGAADRKSLQHQIQAEDDAIKKNQTELTKLGGQ